MKDARGGNGSEMRKIISAERKENHTRIHMRLYVRDIGENFIGHDQNSIIGETMSSYSRNKCRCALKI